ncbi:peptidase inhibitor family I36 protein [Streptomyces abikoensis]|uniref:peptidase inhibitor family I36 protein n=1 Tax=Streptomyces abikoensis TaxID=97398 RepID=UPI0033C5DBFE
MPGHTSAMREATLVHTCLLLTSAVTGAALLLSAGPASADNPPYSECPGWALCFYQNGGGTGSKVVVTPPPAGGNTKTVRLINTHVLNGELAGNQVSSWLNNSQCSVQFWDDPSGTRPGHATGEATAWAQR